MMALAETKLETTKPASVLYVCNHNIIRSPMASVLTRKLFGREIYTTSAGIREGTPDPFVDAVMKEIGVDLKSRPAKTIEALEDTYFDIIIALSPEAYEAVQNSDHIEGAEIGYWFSADPTGEQGSRERMLDAYRAVRDALEKRIEAQFDHPKIA